MTKKKKKKKERGHLGEMPGSRPGEGKTQDELEASYCAKSKALLQHDRDMSKGHKICPALL